MQYLYITNIPLNVIALKARQVKFANKQLIYIYIYIKRMIIFLHVLVVYKHTFRLGVPFKEEGRDGQWSVFFMLYANASK